MMHVHLVFVTKYRREVFTQEIDGEDDHVHLLVNYHPKVAVSVLVNSLKGVSSRMIRQKKYPSIRKKLCGGALWSPSYFADAGILLLTNHAA